jgi:hypothetical protein
VVADFHPGLEPPPQKVQIVDHQQPHLAGQHTVQGAPGELGSRTPCSAWVSVGSGCAPHSVGTRLITLSAGERDAQIVAGAGDQGPAAPGGEP